MEELLIFTHNSTIVMPAGLRFFDIPELVDSLVCWLSRTDISALVCTSKKLYRLCLPSLFKTLDFCEFAKPKIFTSIHRMAVLAGNIQHITDLRVGSEELVLLYSCVYYFGISVQHMASDNIRERPSWFPVLSPHIRPIVSLPPIIHLSRLTVDDSCKAPRFYTASNINDAQSKLEYICWLLYLNPNLTYVHLIKVSIRDHHESQLLAGAISRLQKIKELKFVLRCQFDNIYRLGLDLFFSISPSIRIFNLDIVSTCFIDTSQDQDILNATSIADCLTIVPKRLGPLVNLEELGLWDMNGEATVCDMLSILTVCPNITRLNFFEFNEPQVHQMIVDYISRTCPRITRLDSMPRSCHMGAILPFRIMEALPTQQVASFFINGGSLTLDLPITGPSLLRHTTTLQNINLEFHGGIEKSSTTIFENCINLEVLKLFSVSAGYYIDVTEIQATSWQCLKLRQLDIGVSCCEPPVNPEIQPYYFRSVPITLTRAETEHFTQLERLYLQLGRLTELRRLVVVMVNPYHEITTGTAYMPNTLPALMTLGDESNGRPGYLHYLAGLTKLEFIGGSMDADTEEAKATVGWAEVAWIYEHWPRLHTALIFKLPPNIENPFVWLQNKYEKDGKQLVYFE